MILIIFSEFLDNVKFFEYFKYILKSISVEYFWLNLISRKNNLRNLEFVFKFVRREKFEN